MNNKIELSCYDKKSVSAGNGYSFEELRAKKYFIKAHYYKWERWKKQCCKHKQDDQTLYDSVVESRLKLASKLNEDIRNNINIIIDTKINAYKNSPKGVSGNKQNITQKKLNQSTPKNGFNTSQNSYNHSPLHISALNLELENSTVEKTGQYISQKHNHLECLQISDLTSFQFNDSKQKNTCDTKFSIVKEDPFDKDLKTRILQAFQDNIFVNHNFPQNMPPIPLTHRNGYYLFAHNLMKYRSTSDITPNSWTEKIRNGLNFHIDIKNSHKNVNILNENKIFYLHFEKLLGEGAFAKVYKSIFKQPISSHMKTDNANATPKSPMFMFPLPFSLNFEPADLKENGKISSIITGVIQNFQYNKRKFTSMFLENATHFEKNTIDVSVLESKRIKTQLQTTSLSNGQIEHHTVNTNEASNNLTDASCLLAVKVQSPKDTNWEFYIYSEIFNRLTSTQDKSNEAASATNMTQNLTILEFFPRMFGAFVYLDVSLLLLELYPSGTLLHLVNVYKSKGTMMPESLVSYFAHEILSILLYLHHKCQILHTDIKPDNFLLGDLNEIELLANQFETSNIFSLNHKNNGNFSLSQFTLKLTDFGKSIDLKLYPKNTYFTKQNEEQDFQCPEMIKGLPWNYHLDCFGALGTIHCMVFSEYMKIHKDKRSSAFKITKSLKRGWSASNSETWKDFFDIFLNLNPLPEENDGIGNDFYFLNLLSDWNSRFTDILMDDSGGFKLQNALKTIPRTFFTP